MLVSKVWIMVSAALLVVLLTMTVALDRRARGGFEVTTPEEALAVLRRQASAAAPGSPAAKRLAAQIAKVKRKAAGAVEEGEAVAEEDPGALLEASALLKTRFDGTTYAPNYRFKELTKALQNRKRRAEPLPWVERGPGNVSGRTRALVIDSADASGNTWFAATIGGGVWKTSDGGATWSDKTPNLTALSTTCIAQAGSDPDVFYVGTGMGYGRVVDLAGSGIWKSFDHGETWSQLPATADGQLLAAINRIVIDPNDSGTLLACSNDGFSHLGPKGGERKSGIFRSFDGGASWTQVFDPDAVFTNGTDNRVQQIIATPGNFNILYASVNEVGVIKSVDAGRTWFSSITNMALPGDIGNPPGNGFGLAGISVRIELAIAPTDPNRIYAAVERPRGVADLYMSKDAGASWILVNDTGSDPNWFNSFGQSSANGAYSAGWFDNTIAVHPFDRNVVFVGGVNIYRLNINETANTRTSNLVAYWLGGFGVPQVHGDHHWLAMIPVNQATGSFRIIDGNDGGVAVSNDGGVNWSQRFGLITTQFYGVDKKPGEDVYIGGMQDNGTFHSPSAPDIYSNWLRDLGGDGFEVAWHATDPNLVLADSQYGSYSRSADAGLTWTPIPEANAGAAPFISKIGYSKTDPDLVFTIGLNGVKRSDDFGKSWTLTPIQGNWLGYRPYDNVEVSIADPRVVWITSRLKVNPAAGIAGGIHVSTDSGLSFTEISSRLPSYLDEASGLAVHPHEGRTAYLLFAAPGVPKILKTTDLGQTWMDISGFDLVSGSSDRGFPDVALFDLLIMPFDTNILWAATEIGLFESRDGGLHWEYADNGMPHVGIFQLRIVDDQVLAATQGRGIWSLTLPQLADYRPPVVTLTPRLNRPVLHPSGNAVISVDLRSGYGETVISIDGKPAVTLPANQEPETLSFLYPVDGDGVLNVSVTSQLDGESFKSANRSLAFNKPVSKSGYTTDFNNGAGAAELVSTGFSIATPAGFANGALHSVHPHVNNANYIAMLKSAYLVPETQATIGFDEIVLLEPGSSTDYTNALFFDFAVVEATSDGINWQALAPGWDARDDAVWVNTYNAGGTGTPAMYRHREIDVLQTFAPGEEIFIRLRLFADGGVTGWGWSVDNLAVFPAHVSGGNEDPLRHLVYPWLSRNEQFESLLVVNNPSDQAASVTLTARRESGIGEKIKAINLPAGGFFSEPVSALFPNIAPGSGFTVDLETTSAAVRGRWVTNNLETVTGHSPSQGVAVEAGLFEDALNARVGKNILLGYLPLSDGLISAPVVVNMGGGPTDVTLSFYNAAGTLLLEDTASLDELTPNRPFARVANSLVPGVTESVYLVASSDREPISGVVFVFNQQGEAAIGNATNIEPVAGETATNLLYAWISNNDDFESILVANNLGEAAVTATLTARRENGDSQTVTRDIPAHGFLEETASSLFPALGDGAGYAVQLTAGVAGIHGRWVTNNLKAASGRSPSQGVAVAVPPGSASRDQDAGLTMLFGYLPVTNGVISAPVVVNLGADLTDVTLDFYNAAGELVLRDDTTLQGLAPFQPFARPANLLVPGGTEDLYMVARSTTTAITGVAFVFNAGLEPAIGNATATLATAAGGLIRKDDTSAGRLSDR